MNEKTARADKSTHPIMTGTGAHLVLIIDGNQHSVSFKDSDCAAVASRARHHEAVTGVLAAGMPIPKSAALLAAGMPYAPPADDAAVVPVAEYMERLKPGRYVVIFGRTGDGEVWNWTGSLFIDNNGIPRHLYRGQGWCDGILERIDQITYLSAERERCRAINQAIVAEIGAAGPDNAEAAVFRLLARLATATERAGKLQAFKEYVHSRLDAMGVDKEPNGAHSAEGCRVGDRLDIVAQWKERAEKAEAANAESDACIGAFQDRVRDAVIGAMGDHHLDDDVDGSGSDDGWEDLTLSEVCIGLNRLGDALTAARADAAAANQEGAKFASQAAAAVLEANALKATADAEGRRLRQALEVMRGEAVERGDMSQFVETVDAILGQTVAADVQGDRIHFAVIGPDGFVHYTRPEGEKLLDEARAHPGYSVVPMGSPEHQAAVAKALAKP